MPLFTHGDRDRPRVALTFDDGPSDHTEEVLDVLGEKDASATFNVVGEFVPGREATLRRMAGEGHEIGNHGLRHQRLSGRPLRTLEEILRTGRRVSRAAGVSPRVFRPPYGWVSPGVLAAAGLAGLVTVNWDVNPRDWEAPDPDALVEDVMTWVRPGSIVLLHDGRGMRDRTVAAAGPLVDALRSEGYEPVTVFELLELSA